MRAIWHVLRKDLLLEWRSRARINATAFFAVLTLLLFSFAVGPDQSMLAQNAGGYLWLAVLLASVLSLGESLRVEYENDALEGLRLLPVSATALFYGKALANAIFLFLLGALLFPIAIALYDPPLVAGIGSIFLVLALGAAAFSAPGILYAAIAQQARARDVLLPLLLFPVLTPSLLAAVKATSLALHGDPMGQLQSWLGLLIAFNLIFWSLAGLLFGKVIEDAA